MHLIACTDGAKDSTDSTSTTNDTNPTGNTNTGTGESTPGTDSVGTDSHSGGDSDSATDSDSRVDDSGSSSFCGEAVTGTEVKFVVSTTGDMAAAATCFAEHYDASSYTLVLDVQNDIADNVIFANLRVKILGNHHSITTNSTTDQYVLVSEGDGSQLVLEDLSLNGAELSGGVYVSGLDATLLATNVTVSQVSGAGILVGRSSIFDATNLRFENLSVVAETAIQSNEPGTSITVHGMTITNSQAKSALSLNAETVALSGVRIDGGNAFSERGIAVVSDGSVTLQGIYLAESDFNYGNAFEFSGAAQAEIVGFTSANLTSIDNFFYGDWIATNGVLLNVDAVELANGTRAVSHLTFEGCSSDFLSQADEADDAAGTLVTTTENGFASQEDPVQTAQNGAAADLGNTNPYYYDLSEEHFRGAFGGDEGTTDLLTQ